MVITALYVTFLTSATLTQLLGVIATLITSVIGLMVYLETRWTKRINRMQKEDKEKFQQCVDKVSERIEPVWQEHIVCSLEPYTTKTEFEKLGTSMYDNIKDIQKTLECNHTEIIESEKYRLKGEIIDFAEDLRNGAQKSSVAYQHIHNSYSRYKKLGGNGYIDETFKYIVRTIGEKNEQDS